MREFTRDRIARLCADALRDAGVLGELPTPLEALHPLAGVRAHVDLRDLPGISPALRGRLLGAVWFEERAVFVDGRQSAPRRRFTEAHELAHLLCPWHAAVLRLDTAHELFGPLSRGVEAEANLGAAELLFQGAAFAREAARDARSLRTAFALAPRYGASRHAAALRYVEGSRAPVGLLVAGRWPGPDGCLPVWRGLESPAFARRYGPAAALGVALDAGDGWAGELIAQARRSADPVSADVTLTGTGFRVEVVNNRHCHLVFLTPQPVGFKKQAASGVATRNVKLSSR
jgi:hypothetical protein